MVAYDVDAEAARRASLTETVESLDALVGRLAAPRAIWVMVPAGEATESTLAELAVKMSPGDILIDGGNSNYRDTQRRQRKLAASGLSLVDVGTSGGIWGSEHGYCLMIGGLSEPVGRLRGIFETLAPAPDRGWGHVGPSGAGHFVKMIHNGIEYGMMQALAEGFALLRRKADFELDLANIAEIWRHGSVVRSWLLDLTRDALGDNPSLEGISSSVADSGEGRWTVLEALDQDLAAPIITLALLQRLRSREPEAFAEKLLAAMRHRFGGHSLTGR